jgi:Na+/H+ antiporter 1
MGPGSLNLLKAAVDLRVEGRRGRPLTELNAGVRRLAAPVREIRREFDMGELRERRRVATPVFAAIGGMVAPALIYVAFTAGEPAARGWGITMATDTAFALGVLGLVGRRWPRLLHRRVGDLAVDAGLGRPPHDRWRRGRPRWLPARAQPGCC